MGNLDIRSEESLLFFGALLCSEAKPGNDGTLQIAPLFCSLPFREDCISRLTSLKARLSDRFPSLIAFGDRRAAKAYRSQIHSITKPSYGQRLNSYGSEGKNQLTNIAGIAMHEPASGGLVFSVFEPSDLENRYRPGYVPCLVSGSFVLHEGEYHLNAFFRSQSIIEFGIQDLIFLREFQIGMLERFNSNNVSVGRKMVAPGPLNLHFGRIIIQRRLMRHKRVFVKRDQIVCAWLDAVRLFIEESQNA